MPDNRPGKPMRESQVSMMELVMPDHANVRGTIFGGRVMALIDIAGAMAALRHCRNPVVTASVDRLDFRAPIRVGEFIMLHANVNYAGRTSMEVGVRVVGEHPLTGEQRHTATAFLTYVALDEHGRPIEIPEVLPETPEEEMWLAQAKHRRALRLVQRETDTTP